MPNEILNEDDDIVFLDYKPMSHKARKAIGHNAERKFRLMFIDLWKQQYCETSRHTAKFLDKCGIDFVGLPVRIQLKAGNQQGLSPMNELIYIHSQCCKRLQPDDTWLQKVKVLIHHRNGKINKERKRESGVTKVYMTGKDFKVLLGLYFDKTQTNIDRSSYTVMKSKVDTDNEFDVLITTTFEVLTLLIVTIFPEQLNPEINNDNKTHKKRGR